MFFIPKSVFYNYGWNFSDAVKLLREISGRSNTQNTSLVTALTVVMIVQGIYSRVTDVVRCICRTGRRPLGVEAPR